MFLAMGWKGALRSYGAYQRAQLRSERREMREAQRAAREQLAQQKQELVEKLVERYEMQLRLLSTVHHDCGPTIDWQEAAVRACAARTRQRQQRARSCRGQRSPSTARRYC